jgi:hypothetical protein
MMKETIRALETGVFAELALFSFLLAFALILVWTLALPARARDAAKQLPLRDAEPFSPEHPHG